MIRFVMVALLVAGCSKASESTAEKPAPSASTTMAVASASASSSAAAAKAAPAPTTYAGTYTVTPAKLYIPDSSGWNGVKQAKDDPAKNVGEGALSLSIDPSGKVTGAIDSGPASPAIIDGQLVGEEIRGVVRRKTPSDDGLTGTIVASPGGEGTMSLADGNVTLVREAKLSLKKN